MTHDDNDLKDRIDRIIFLLPEIQSMREDIATIYADAKNDGYNVDAMKRLVKVASADETKQEKMRQLSECMELYAGQIQQPLLLGMTL